MDEQSASNLAVLFVKPEIYTGVDEVATSVRRNLPTLQTALKNCERMDHEMQSMCQRISEHVENMMDTNNDKPLEIYLNLKSRFFNLNK